MLEQKEHKAGYKWTALGWIPEGWGVARLEEVATVVQGISKGRNLEGKQPTLLPYLRVANVKDGAFDLREIKEITLLPSEVSKYLLDKGDVILTEGGDPDKLGRGSIWNGEISPCVFQNHLFRIRSNPSILEAKFLAHYVGGKKAKDYFQSSAKQTTGIASINATQVRNTPIPLPPLAEQRAIADLLGCWDRAIGAMGELIRQKQARKKWLMQVLLTGKRRLPGFKGEWNRVKLGEVFDRVAQKNTGGCTTVVTISAHRGFVLQTDFFNKSIASESLEGYFLVKKGDFCYNKSYSGEYEWGAIKRLKSFDEAVVTTLYICFRLVDRKNHDAEFWEWFFEAQRLNRGLAQIAHEGGRAHGLLNVAPADFFGMETKVPDVAEQHEIASILEAADRDLRLHEAKLERLKMQKRGLMQLLLTGRRRIN